MEVLAIIPARGGSKGLPRKNIRSLNGKPLIAYTIEESKKSEYINRIVVSTEDKEIAEVSNKYGAKILKRPLELAKDDTPTIDVVLHILNNLKNNEPDIVVLLQPTSPLRTSQDIDNAIKSFIEQDCDSVVSVCEVEHPPYWSFKIENNNYLKPIFGEGYFKKRRQELPKAYMPNGALFITTPNVLRKYKSFYCKKTMSHIMPIERSVDIDNEIDFLLAEILINRRLENNGDSK